jgi:hypothetical protein
MVGELLQESAELNNSSHRRKRSLPHFHRLRDFLGALRCIPDHAHDIAAFYTAAVPGANVLEVSPPAGYLCNLVAFELCCDDDFVITIWLVVSGESTRLDLGS